jgi:hypothetical protein
MNRIWSRVLWAPLALAGLGGCAVINRMDGMSQANELKRKGVPAEATIIKIWDTGMTVNNDPVVGFLLEVHPREGGAYQAETKILVSRLSIPQPGQIVPVRYDPVRPSRVSLEVGVPDEEAAAPLPAPTPLPRAADLEPEKQRLLAIGVPGTATIVRCEALGLFDADGRPAYDLVVRLELPGRAPVEGPTRVAVAKEREHWFNVGQRLPIKADPDAPTHFAVDWERLE